MIANLKYYSLYILLLFVSCSSSSDNFTSEFPPGGNPNNPPDGVSFEINLIQDSFEGENFVVAGSQGWNFMVAFHTDLEGTTLELEALSGELPVIMQDKDGNRYDIFGKVLSGANQGKYLTPMNAFMGYWFSWGAFYPGLEIFENSLPLQNAGSGVTGSDGWLIPRNQVFVGALRDAIPAIENPDFQSLSLDPDDDNNLVIGVKINDVSRAYPHSILNWHEIVNDQIDDTYFSVIFCPLTGTATVWNRFINEQITTFGVSGFLYNSNVVPYDRNTSSNWSQMLQKSVQGSLSSTPSDNIFVLETTVETWRAINATYEILTTNTGFSRNYEVNPYGNYPTNSSVNFPINFSDDRLHPKERVLGVIVNEKAKAYRFESFK